jgi:hypothetical protein
MKRLFPAALLAVLSLSGGSDPLDEITAQALLHSRAYSFLEELCDQIGPRVTGSTEAVQATSWAAHTMQAIGLRNVHVENWQLEHSWRRGAATAELLRPFRTGLNIVSYGWVGSTRRGGVEAEVVPVDSDLLGEEIARHAGAWTGKVLLLTPKGPKHISGAERIAQLGGLLEAAGRSGAVAVIARDARPGTMLTHTGPPGFAGALYSIGISARGD